ncbi:MAG TPA: hypothetical protein VD793_11320 [Gemmatimonadales bacterium]|nr:hypothetical protein [Gemmatimonadales bacterium]
MALIDCPECAERVSSYAWACPHCGFPVSEYGQQAVEEVTGSEHAKTGRQRTALAHLARWARAYTKQSGPSQPVVDHEDRTERGLRWASTGLAVVVVALVLLLLFRSVYG